MVEGAPAFGRIFGTAGNQKRAWSHERVKFMQIAPVRDQLFVSPRAWIVGSRHAGFSLGARFTAQVPRLPVINVWPRFVENDSWIGPRCACEFVVQTRAEHRPFASVRMAHNPDALGVHIRQSRDRIVTVRRNITEEGEWLAVRFAGF